MLPVYGENILTGKAVSS